MFQFKFLNELNECLKTINDGGIILHPTDTVYGIGGNANDNNATRKINRIKKRRLNQPLIHLMSDIEMVNCYVENISETAIEFLSDSNPTTVIFSRDCKFTIISCNILIVKISNAANGSSKRRICGSLINAIEITNFFFCPPDKCFAFTFKIGSNSNCEIILSIFNFLKSFSFICISPTSFKFSNKFKS